MYLLYIISLINLFKKKLFLKDQNRIIKTLKKLIKLILIFLKITNNKLKIFHL